MSLKRRRSDQPLPPERPWHHLAGPYAPDSGPFYLRRIPDATFLAGMPPQLRRVAMERPDPRAFVTALLTSLANMLPPVPGDAAPSQQGPLGRFTWLPGSQPSLRECLVPSKWAIETTKNARLEGGYLRLRLAPHVFEQAHRIVVWAFFGPPGDHPESYDGSVCMHACNNKRCLNPEHLIWGSMADNLADTRRPSGIVANARRALLRASRYYFPSPTSGVQSGPCL